MSHQYRSPLFVAAWIAVILLGCALALPARAEAPGGDAGLLTEPSTGQVFQFVTGHPDGDGELVLTGVGVRKKLWFKVYALGFYVAPSAGPVLREASDVYETLLDLPADRLVVMRFVRNVDGGSMHDALAEAMDRGVPKDDPARQAFLDFWQDEIGDGEEVSLLFGDGGRLAVYRDSTLRGEVRSVPVARAVLASWLGDDPVSDAIKDGVIQRIPKL
jgi:hypothetical protein